MRSFIVLIVVLGCVSAGGHSGKDSNSHEGRGGGGRSMGPPFLANVTQEGRSAFFQLFRNQNQTKGQLKTAVGAWAASNGVEEALTAFETQMEAEKSERRANVTTAVGQLPEALAKLNAIEDAQDLTMAETREQISAAIQAMSPELRALVLAVGPKGGRKGKGDKWEKKGSGEKGRRGF